MSTNKYGYNDISMFGNLFNQKNNNNDQNVQPQAPQVVQTGQTEQTTTSFGIQAGPAVIAQTDTVTNVQNMPIPQQPPAPGVGVPPVSVQPPQGVPQPGTAPADPNVATEVQTVGMDPTKRENVSALSRLDARAAQVLHHAQEETKRVKQALIEPDQVLYGLIYDGDIYKLLEQFQISASKIAKDIQAKAQLGTFTGQPTLSPQSQEIFESAFSAVKARQASFITPEDILLALFNAASMGEFLKSQGMDKNSVEEKLAKNSNFVGGGKRSVLDKYSIDLTQNARDGMLDPVTGRDTELERLIHILLRRTKNNPIIIGEAGVGKTAIVEALAQKLVAGEVPEELKNKKVIQLDLASMVAGASHRGEFEERLRSVIQEVQASGEIILFVDEIHMLVGAGGSDGAMNASNIIKPYLARGQLQLIGTTTTAEFRKYFEKDKAFERRFQPIMVAEPTEDVAIEMMNVIKPKYEKFHDVVMTPEAVSAAVHLSKKYIGERYLPDKAVDLLDEAAAEVKLQKAQGKRQDNNIIKTDIEKVVSSWTGIPITRLTEDESEKLLKLEELIHKRFIDQTEAVTAVSEAVRRGRIGLSAANRPIASFIFLGPTGVGKTELAKTLAEILFGRDDATIRLDMSEYMEKHEVAKLIGAPPGYVGYEEGGQLTEAVRAKPYSIVLLDEVEKAHPDVFNILLQILEDGRLTDNKGNTISFKNTIIIATSNLGSQVIQKFLLEKAKNASASKKTEEAEKKEQGDGQASPNEIGQPETPEGENDKKPETAYSKQEIKLKLGSNSEAEGDFAELTKLLQEELHKFFRPELLNRFDDLVVFKPLAQADMMQIAKLGIGKTQKLLNEQGYEVEITEKALAQLAEEGYDPVYGARPLRRLIQSSIENSIAIALISKQFAIGDTIVIDYDEQNQKYTFIKGVPKNPQVQQAGEGQIPGQTGENASVQSAPSQQGTPVPPVNGVQNTVPAPQNPQQPQSGVPPQTSQASVAPPIQEHFYGAPPLPESQPPAGNNLPPQPPSPSGTGATIDGGMAAATA